MRVSQGQSRPAQGSLPQSHQVQMRDVFEFFALGEGYAQASFLLHNFPLLVKNVGGTPTPPPSRVALGEGYAQASFLLHNFPLLVKNVGDTPTPPSSRVAFGEGYAQVLRRA